MASINEVTVTADKIYRRKLFVRLSKIIFLLLFIIVSLVYVVLYLIYNGSGFSIKVDRDLVKSKIFLTLDPEGSKNVEKTRYLKSKAVDWMDNISIKWISPNIDKEAVGDHNGDNYYAYTFFVINDGDTAVNYWYEIDIEDSMKNLDEAIRVMVYHNGERTVYAKINSRTKQPEKETKAFYSDEIAVLEEVKNFEAGTRDRFTVVMWIEGDDPDCNNELLGGGVHMNMKLTEERIIR